MWIVNLLELKVFELSLTLENFLPQNTFFYGSEVVEKFTYSLCSSLTCWELVFSLRNICLKKNYVLKKTHYNYTYTILYLSSV